MFAHLDGLGCGCSLVQKSNIRWEEPSRRAERVLLLHLVCEQSDTTASFRLHSSLSAVKMIIHFTYLVRDLFGEDKCLFYIL